MTLPIYVAMTAAEFAHCKILPKHTCWMACHLSASNTGLSNIPYMLPENSILMVNDQNMPNGHDPALIATQLLKMAEAFQLCGIILDMQRPRNTEVQAICDAVRAMLPCPVAVTPLYAAEQDVPVFLPPVPKIKTVREYLSPWRARELWLELDSNCSAYTITGNGCATSCFHSALPQPVFTENSLHCHYNITTNQDAAVFTLQRTAEDQQALLSEAAQFGVKYAFDFYRIL